MEREQKKREEAKCLVEEEAKRRKAAERANSKALAAAVSKPPAKRSRCEPLYGTLVLNLISVVQAASQPEQAAASPAVSKPNSGLTRPMAQA